MKSSHLKVVFLLFWMLVNPADSGVHSQIDQVVNGQYSPNDPLILVYTSTIRKDGNDPINHTELPQSQVAQYLKEHTKQVKDWYGNEFENLFYFVDKAKDGVVAVYAELKHKKYFETLRAHLKEFAAANHCFATLVQLREIVHVEAFGEASAPILNDKQKKKGLNLPQPPPEPTVNLYKLRIFKKSSCCSSEKSTTESTTESILKSKVGLAMRLYKTETRLKFKDKYDDLFLFSGPVLDGEMIIFAQLDAKANLFSELNTELKQYALTHSHGQIQTYLEGLVAMDAASSKACCSCCSWDCCLGTYAMLVIAVPIIYIAALRDKDNSTIAESMNQMSSAFSSTTTSDGGLIANNSMLWIILSVVPAILIILILLWYCCKANPRGGRTTRATTTRRRTGRRTRSVQRHLYKLFFSEMPSEF